MRILRSLWLCLGGTGQGNVTEKVVSACPAKEKGEASVADGDVEVKRTVDGKARISTKSIDKNFATAAGQDASLAGAKGCEAGAGKSPGTDDAPMLSQRHSFLAGDLHNERTLRALLHRAKARLSEQNQAFSVELQNLHVDSGRPEVTADPELARMNAQLMETCSQPKADPRSLLRLELLLEEVRRWLSARASPTAATAVLYAVGDGLVHAEHMVRSVGQVRFWQPENTSVFMVLLQLYSDLLLQATRVAELHRQLQQQQLQDKAGEKREQERKMQQQPQKSGEQAQQHQPNIQRPRGGSDVVAPGADDSQQQQQQQAVAEAQQTQQPEQLQPVQQVIQQQRRLVTENIMPHLSDMAMSLEYNEHGGFAVPSRCAAPKPQQQQQQQQQPPPLAFAAAALMLRPDWLDMLAEVLELLHFNEDYRLAAMRAGLEPQEALAKALQLWCFLTQLIKFAAAHSDAVQRMEPCLQRLAALLTSPSGIVPRLLALTLAEDTLVAQLHALWLLQVLYDMPDAKVLYSAPLADYYVALHHNAMVQSYEASAGDPKSAAAELCRIHATLLRSMARHPGEPVRAAFARAKTVHWILQEISLESQLLAAAAQRCGIADEPDSDSDSSDDDKDDDEDDNTDLTITDNDEVADSGGVAVRSGSSNDTAVDAEQRRIEGKQRPLSPVTSAETAGLATEVESPTEVAAAGERQLTVASHLACTKFSFTYDLNEDVERLIALEDALGREMELDGFEFDEEGKQLKARSDARLAEALAAQAEVAATAAAEVEASPLPPCSALPAAEPTNLAQALQQQQTSSMRELVPYNSGAGCGSLSQHASGIPRLALAGLRSASISSLAIASPAGGGGGGKRSSGHGGRRSSHTGSSALGILSVHVEDEDSGGGRIKGAAPDVTSSSDGNDADDYNARAPSPGAAAMAAERLEEWSSTLAAAYAAASAGDDSKLPYPPQRTRSQGSGNLGMPTATASTSSVGSEHRREQQQQQRQSGPINGHAAVAAAVMEEQGPTSPLRPREVTSGSSVHCGPHGEMHIMVQSSGTMRASQVGGITSSAHGRPPLPTKPALPPLKMGLTLQPESSSSAAIAAPPPMTSPKSILSARGAQLVGSRAMVALSASNRAHQAAASPKQSFSGVPLPQPQSQPQPLWSPGAPAVEVSSSAPPPRLLTQLQIPALNLNSLRRRAGGEGSNSFAAAPTDTGRTVPLSCMLRNTNVGSLSNCSGMDSANTVLRSGGTSSNTPSSSANTYGPTFLGGVPTHGASNLGMLRRITETEQLPPEVAYQEIACQRLLYMDRTTHILLLKVLVDLLVAPSGVLDPGYVPQYPSNNGMPHAEFIMLWHLNAPRNNGVVHDLCRGAQHRAQQAAASAVRRAAADAAATSAIADAIPHSSSTSSLTPLLSPLQRQRQQLGNSASCRAASNGVAVTAEATGTVFGSFTVASIALVAVPTRASAVTRALQLLSRPLFDASRYTNLQFVARGTFGDVYRARMNPPLAQAWTEASTATVSGRTGAEGTASPPAPIQVVIKTIQLPGSPHDACVLSDVFGEVSVMERFTGHDFICQLIDYGMRNDAYWLVMRRYRCSLAEWRGRQKPLADLAAVDITSGNSSAGGGSTAAAAAARVYLSALLQIIDALRLLAAHHVVHFDLKCSNVLIEPLPGVRDSELWAPVGVPAATSTSTSVPFRCVLADFGEARAYRCAEEAFTARNRGTEVFKSPEMLLLNALGRSSGKPAAEAEVAVVDPHLPSLTQPQLSPNLHRQQLQTQQQQQQLQSSVQPSSPSTSNPPRPSTAETKWRQALLSGAGLASDVWSLGCLAFELLSGTVLFGGDYASVTHRVAFGAGKQLSLTEVERRRLANLPELVELVEWVLVRDPGKRPSLELIRERVTQVRATLGAMC